MIPRYTYIKKKRSKPRRGRLQGDDLLELRADCYRRDFGICRKCSCLTNWDASHESDNSYHMSHIKAKRMGGDTLENVETLCGACHRKYHNFGPSMEKPCPPKPKED